MLSRIGVAWVTRKSNFELVPIEYDDHQTGGCLEQVGEELSGPGRQQEPTLPRRRDLEELIGRGGGGPAQDGPSVPANIPVSARTSNVSFSLAYCSTAATTSSVVTSGANGSELHPRLAVGGDARGLLVRQGQDDETQWSRQERRPRLLALTDRHGEGDLRVERLGSIRRSSVVDQVPREGDRFDGVRR